MSRARETGSDMTLWGSECVECENATPGEMTCDNCGSNEHTVPLYYLDRDWQAVAGE